MYSDNVFDLLDYVQSNFQKYGRVFVQITSVDAGQFTICINVVNKDKGLMVGDNLEIIKQPVHMDMVDLLINRLKKRLEKHD